MARPIPCDLDQVENSQWMIGNLTTGEQTALCDSCLTLWILGKLDEVLSAEAKAHVAGLWAPAPAAAAAAGDGAADAPKRRSGGRRRARRAGDDPQDVVTALQAAPEATAAEEAESDRGVAEAPPPDHDS